MFKINLRSITIAAIAMLTCIHLKAQTVKPVFKKLVLAVYRVDTIKGHQKITVMHYLDIDDTGELHLKGETYNRDGSAYDTTYQMPDAELTRINRLMGMGFALKTFMIRDKQPPGIVVGGPLAFISYTRSNGDTENFIWVYPFMDRNFNSAFGFPVNWYRNKASSPKKTTDPQLEADILKTHDSCTYLPIVDIRPPTVRELKVADPAVKQ